jgi:hypothetical protein
MMAQTLGARMMDARFAIGSATAVADGRQLPEYVLFALARIRLLHDLPFRYLVPDARLLPNEAIRFFTLDEAWLNRVIEGALDAASVSSRERARARDASGLAGSAAAGLRYGVRKVSLGRMSFEQIASEPRDFAPGTISGFLLRSRLVSDWPRMAIRAWSTASPAVIPPGADTAALEAQRPELVVPVLRFERLDPSIMLVLFDGVPELVWLEEPPTGVQLGFEAGIGGNRVDIRDEQGRDTAISVTVPLRLRQLGGVEGVVDIAALAASIDQRRPLAAARGSAGLAQQLLRGPVRQRFAGEPG